MICDYPTEDLKDYSSETESDLEIPENIDVNIIMNAFNTESDEEFEVFD